jgi:hypothetical protein
VAVRITRAALIWALIWVTDQLILPLIWRTNLRRLLWCGRGEGTGVKGKQLPAGVGVGVSVFVSSAGESELALLSTATQRRTVTLVLHGQPCSWPLMSWRQLQSPVFYRLHVVGTP